MSISWLSYEEAHFFQWESPPASFGRRGLCKSCGYDAQLEAAGVTAIQIWLSLLDFLGFLISESEGFLAYRNMHGRIILHQVAPNKSWISNSELSFKRFTLIFCPAHVHQAEKCEKEESHLVFCTPDLLHLNLSCTNLSDSEAGFGMAMSEYLISEESRINTRIGC